MASSGCRVWSLGEGGVRRERGVRLIGRAITVMDAVGEATEHRLARRHSGGTGKVKARDRQQHQLPSSGGPVDAAQNPDLANRIERRRIPLRQSDRLQSPGCSPACRREARARRDLDPSARLRNYFSAGAPTMFPDLLTPNWVLPACFSRGPAFALLGDICNVRDIRRSRERCRAARATTAKRPSRCQVRRRPPRRRVQSRRRSRRSPEGIGGTWGPARAMSRSPASGRRVGGTQWATAAWTSS
jgi:hypothetical protein